MHRLRVMASVALLICACTAPAAAQLRSSIYVSGVNLPVAFVQDPTDRTVQFVVEQRGRIRVIKNGTVQATDFLNLTSELSTEAEQGLLGMAFAPDYATSGRLFVNFTNTSGNTVVARFKRSANPLVADPNTRFDLRWGGAGGPAFIAQPYANHNGGHLAFGPDGYLYIGLGDGGASDDPQNRAQTPSTLLGKMLRIDINVPDSDPSGYQVPGSNPFVSSGPAGVLPEIWSFGLRNPWRYSFDDPARGGTGALVIGDVGQNRYEEVDYEPANLGGRNYGWRNREGLHDNVTTVAPAYLPLVDPIHEYDHTSGGQSITGGFVYRGQLLGAAYRGRYFFADFIRGRVWSAGLSIDGSGNASVTNILEHTAELGGGLGNISSFGVDADGELYILSYSTATVRRILGPTINQGSDVNGDGAHDLLWRNATTGENVVWYLNGTSFVGGANLASVPDPAWQLVATADVNRDGHPDLIWRHQSTGANAVWYLNGTTLIGTANLPTVADLSWQLAASADLNLDGAPDLIWRNLVSGANVVWYLNQATVIGTANLDSVPDLAWQLVASADMNQDGAPDLLWRHAATGANAVWYLNGTTQIGQASYPVVPDLAWRLVSAVDFNNDGQPELVWRHTLYGTNVVWTVSGSSLTGQTNLPTVADRAWRLVGSTPPDIASDANGDRHPDLFWRNTSTGANVLWYLSGNVFVSQASLPTVGDPAWQRVATADLNGDTHPDLIWRNASTGANVVWYMNGAAILGQASLTAVTDTAWRIVAAADVNRDVYPDLIWRNTTTGENAVWYLRDATLIGQARFPPVSDLSWTIVGAADINGDTYPDLVWRNSATGANVVWALAGNAYLGQGSLPTVPDTAWGIGHIADVNGDGHPDLIWRNTSTGENVIWYLSGTSFVGQVGLPAVADTNWILRP